MTKLQVFDLNGKKTKEITTSIFDSDIREDLVQKIAETEKEKQPYAPFLWAGMQTSASGNVKHNRHTWKSDRGKGVSRYPKKRMSDKGERFVWVAAVVPGVRKGRRAHPPKIIKTDVKINQKERMKGLLSALAMVSSEEMVKKKYSSLENSKITIKLPLVFDVKITTAKAKEFFNALRQTLGEDLFAVAIQKKEIRAGLGKKRNRRYKSNAGMLIVIGNNEERKIGGVEVIKARDLKIINLAVNGPRLTAFTEQAIKDLELKINPPANKNKEAKK
jgi:large subunit ribosomal protein L4e